ncbi:MAG: glycerophosphodiester phosphodiesterase [Rhodocyclales bacterium]|nr:glycerophosphodiester phosphodiesterase [Rhodocyclales bacterium]
MSLRPTFFCLLAALLAGCASPHPAPFAQSDGKPLLLAHRGVSQSYDKTGIDNDTCTATRIRPPTHGYLENTLASMRASIAAGADIIELDVHPTTDGEFAVFHDWTLDCRTEGAGRTRDHSMAELKKLDIGFGYTADGGRTYPFRGRGSGLMPSLGEVLATFPERRLLINIKSNDDREGELLAAYLNDLPAARRRLLAVYGGANPVAVLRERVPEIVTMTKSSLKACLLGYVAIGWTGLLPASCERTLVLVPKDLGGWLWGWPERFVQRMREVGSAVFVTGDYRGRETLGIDSPTDLATLPAGYPGGIWTNEIHLIGPMLKARQPTR